MAAISAEVTGPRRSTDDVLASPRLRTRHTYASATVLSVINRGFAVLPTFGTPHVSIVLPEYNAAHAHGLIVAFGPEQPNPHYLRTPR